jgi:hypothetical protein
MSNHFKYEINEVNLKLQLKGHELPFNDEAWKRFESFSNSQKTIVRNDVMQRFSVKLNRNVVLPIVFGSVIILFSFLLLNFINIKNPNIESSAKIETEQNAVVSTHVLNKTQTPSKPAIQAVSLSQDSTLAVNTEIKQTMAQTSEVIPSNQDLVKNTPSVSNKDNYGTERSANKAMAKSDSSKGENDLTSTTQQQEDATPKGKSKKSVAIVTEPTDEEINQTPPPVSQAGSSAEIEVQN